MRIKKAQTIFFGMRDLEIRSATINEYVEDEIINETKNLKYI